MYIGLFSESDNPCDSSYRGLYRPVDFIDYLECGNDRLAGAIYSYFENSKDALYTEFSEQSFLRLKLLRELLICEGWRGDLLLFTDKVNAIIPKDFCFLGYDIFALDFFGSPLGEGVMDYDEDYEFFSEMDKASLVAYRSGINHCGLFDDHSVAQSFSEYCHRINRKYPDCIESDAHWKPFAVYAMPESFGNPG